MHYLRLFFSILLPPLGVALRLDVGLQFWLNVGLTALGYIPGVLHVLWIILRR